MYEAIFAKYAPTKDNLIYVLHEIQNAHPQHYLSEEAVEKVGEYLHVPVNHIYGVLTFYTMYSTKPRGSNIVRLCESPPCYLKGSDDIMAAFREVLGVKAGETTPDGLFTLEKCACLGVCGNAPVCMINEDVYGDLTKGKVQAIVDKIRGGNA